MLSACDHGLESLNLQNTDLHRTKLFTNKSHGRNVLADELQFFPADSRVILGRTVGEFEPQEAPKHTEPTF